MKFRKIILIVELTIIITFGSYLLHNCVGIVYIWMTHLSEDEMEWCVPSNSSAYLNTETIFLSNDGDTAILKYLSCKINNKRTPFVLKISPGDSYIANASYEYNIYSNKDTLEGDFLLLKPFEKNVAVIWSKLNGFYANGLIDDKDLPNVTDAIPIKIKNRIYPHCLVFDSVNSSYGDWARENINNKISKYIISKEMGLIYYKFSDGREYFKLVNDTLQLINSNQK